MLKRGQVTIFIVVGLIIFSVFAGITLLLKQTTLSSLPTEKVPAEVAPVKSFVENCLEKTAHEGLYLLGQQGGYYELEQESPELFYFNLFPIIYAENNSRLEPVLRPYYFSEQGKNFPSLQKIESELSKYLQENLPFCLNQFNDFKELYEIKTGELIASANFFYGQTLLELNYPLQITYRQKDFSLNHFKVNLNFDFLEKYELVEKMIQEQEINLRQVPLGYLTNLAYEHDFTFETITFADAPIIQFDFIFTEDFGEKPYIYAFMIKYDWNEEEIVEEEI